MALGRTFGTHSPATYRIASNRARMAALPSSITAAGSRPNCLHAEADETEEGAERAFNKVASSKRPTSAKKK
jgi:hypothetical protein